MNDLTAKLVDDLEESREALFNTIAPDPRKGDDLPRR